MRLVSDVLWSNARPYRRDLKEPDMVGVGYGKGGQRQRKRGTSQKDKFEIVLLVSFNLVNFNPDFTTLSSFDIIWRHLKNSN